MLDCREQYDVRTAFAFCASNRNAADLERVAARMLSPFGFAIGRVDGTMSAQARDQRLAPLRQDQRVAGDTEADAVAPTRLVANCRVLAEGVDLPAVDLVVFADAKSSHIDILQCMGRASRVAPGKECGYVLVPVSEAAAEGGSYETAVSVMRAYAEQDEEFREALNALVQSEARFNRTLDVTEWPAVMRQVLVLPEDAMPVQRAVARRRVSTIARELVDTWEVKYGLLLAFVEREGNANVPQGHLENNERLGAWLSKQRSLYKRGRLLSERVQRLEAVGVAWDVMAEQWERMFSLLRAYREREGHANVPATHVEDGERLGGWLSSQRTRYQLRGLSEAERKKRRASALSDEEVERLEEVGVAWTIRRG